jgi:hypothetical protein
MIVQISLVANGKFLLLVLDDGSGENIEVKIERLQEGSANRMPQFGLGSIAQYSSTTVVKNLFVPAISFLDSITIDKKLATIGTVILAGGTIVTFRDSRQIMLAQVSIINDTETEITYWSQVATWKRTKLAKPWVLTAQQQEDHEEKLRQDVLKAEAKTCKRQRRERQKERERQETERRAEEKRREEEIQMNEGAMRGSDRIRKPWEDYVVSGAPALYSGQISESSDLSDPSSYQDSD